MRATIFSLITFTSFLLFDVSAGEAQEFRRISDRYSCGRLADGKLYVVIESSTGFKTVKKGGATAYYNKQLKANLRRLEILNDARTKLRRRNLSRRDASAVNAVLRKVDPFLLSDDFEGSKLQAVNTAIARVRREIRLIARYKSEISRCENQRIPNVIRIGTARRVIVLQGSGDTVVGILTTTLRTSKKGTGITLCGVGNQVNGQNVPTGVRQGFRSFFADDLCRYFPERSRWGVSDCRSMIGGNLWASFAPVVFLPAGTPLGSDAVSDAIIYATERALAVASQYVPISRAPGRDCTRLK